MIKDITQAIVEEYKKSKQFKALLEGFADYEDLDIASVKLAEKVSKLLRGSVPELGESITKEDALLLFGDTLKPMYEQITSSADKTLQGLSNLNVASATPKFDTNRIDGLATKLSSDTLEKTQWVLGEPVVNFAQAVVADHIQENAAFRSKLGYPERIVRVFDGESCDYCRNLAGEYEYNDRPSDIFRRHERCRCTVKYYPSGERKGWTASLAKGQTDVNHELYNTGVYHSTYRKTVLARRRKQLSREEHRKLLAQEWRGGLNGNAERHFS